MSEDEVHKVVEDLQESWGNLKSIIEENLAPNLGLKKIVKRRNSERLSITLEERKDGTYVLNEWLLSLSGEEQEEDIKTLLNILESEELSTH